MRKRHIPKNLRHIEKRKNINIAASALAVCFVLSVVLIGVVVARYQRQLRSDGSVRAQEFYFTSNLLDGDTHMFAPGSTEVTFTLGNHADELRVSEMDIDYEVTIAPDGGEPETIKKGTLKKGEVSDEDVTISGLEAGTYVVTAVGTGGYSQTLTATIVVPAITNRIYQHQDNVSGEYILLTVWNEGDKEGTVTIEYTGIPDNTNPDMKDWSTNGKKEIKIAPHESKVFRFFSGMVTVTGAVDKEPS